MRTIYASIFRVAGHCRHHFLSGALCFIFIIPLVLSSSAKGESFDDFPDYPFIQTNVAFWEDVYGRYTTTEGILHDTDRLDIVYGVVALENWEAAGAGQINRELIKFAKERYNGILQALSKGTIPKTPDEKRIAAMFKKPGAPTYKQAMNNIRLQIGQKDRFLQGVIRSGAYIPFIKNIFKSHGLPTLLAYLPHVESSFNPEAHSKAGAVGLWQFTRGTGKQYLTINDIMDERYDPVRSSHAAALFLKDNFEKLPEWPLALTAYNHGPAGMLRAVQLHGSYENIYKKHSGGRFKFASRNFYPEFIAAVRVAHKLEKDPSLIKDRPTATISIRLRNYISLKDLSAHFQIATEDVVRFNPSFRTSIIIGDKYIPKNIFVNIPATERTRSLASTIPSYLYHSDQLDDVVHVVRLGDTAGSVAKKYNVKLDDLIRVNKLNRQATITVGQKLQLPSRIRLAASPKKKRF